jgi:hypothetical protein
MVPNKAQPTELPSTPLSGGDGMLLTAIGNVKTVLHGLRNFDIYKCGLVCAKRFAFSKHGTYLETGC